VSLKVNKISIDQVVVALQEMEQKEENLRKRVEKALRSPKLTFEDTEVLTEALECHKNAMDFGTMSRCPVPVEDLAWRLLSEVRANLIFAPSS
jgi:endonuclease/exonuclease/phosphatase family metal-dependent hydrolase